MRRAYAEMGAADITDTRPGAASGVRPPKDLEAVIVDDRSLDETSALQGEREAKDGPTEPAAQ